ncbi:MAG: RNA polymerase sigma factor [Planctomycetota bacterium]
MPRAPLEDDDATQAALDWLDQYGDRLYRYALLRVRVSATAEDLVQETFLSAIRASDRFAARSSRETWLIGILRHKIGDHFRRLSRDGQLGTDDPDHPLEACPAQSGSNPFESATTNEIQQQISVCIDELPDTLRSAFVFRVLDDLRPQEAAELLQIRVDNLAARLYRARLFLRECLEKYGVWSP